MTVQTQNDYKRIFSELQDALHLSAEAYDRGFKGEAKRLAATVRVLLHDTSNSISLFKQLNVKDAGKYFATPSPYSKGNLLTQCHLVRLIGGSTDLYQPVLDDFPPVFAWSQLDFDEWWTEPIIRDKQKRLLSRRDIVLALANKDGGSHVDPKLDAKYADLSRRNSLAWVISTGSGVADPDYGPEYACMRQIAFELSKTIRHKSGLCSQRNIGLNLSRLKYPVRPGSCVCKFRTCAFQGDVSAGTKIASSFAGYSCLVRNRKEKNDKLVRGALGMLLYKSDINRHLSALRSFQSLASG